MINDVSQTTANIAQGKSPYQQACTDLVAFKLTLLETVAADPRLAKAPCLAAITVYLSFLTIDKETLKPKPVYASNLKLMARGNIRTKVTAGLARRTLVKEGYLLATNSTTRYGCAKFRVANPHSERVQMHVRESEDFYARKEIERKEDERRKRILKRQGVIVTDTPCLPRGDNNYTDRVIVTDTKYHRVNLRDYLLEGDAHYQRDVSEKLTSYADLDDDPHQPFPKPVDDHDAESMIDSICAGKDVEPRFRNRLKSMLNDAILTPNMAIRMLAQMEAAA
ncbi:hypothetical protein IHQ71_04420 [Rhizobium sp. TH2]|uniref:hypothetical protein n=1 Tax=Rhizobium sp. TH2 TaxID=2775403 RepID=UPI0021577C7E|nr:hypothetical protein [Rhizobium sp. TH2]UVC09864.1 hypothetical protein IHQ71_04420 [Rhizobium sp. TH2]